MFPCEYDPSRLDLDYTVSVGFGLSSLDEVCSNGDGGGYGDDSDDHNYVSR